MKKFFMFLAVAGLMAFTANIASAQEEADSTAATEQVAEEAAPVEVAEEAVEVPLHQAIKTKFIEGGAGFMSLVVICLILGLALAIERILFLTLSKTNTKKLLESVEAALAEGGIEKAKDVCRETRGPIAEMFYEGLEHYNEGVETVEKYITSQGSIEQSKLESGLTWIALFIAIAPSLGFLGTVIGMIQAFDDIQKAGDISPNVVAGGMKVALITTVAGLIVAMILQIFFNYITAKIESITVDMESSELEFVNILTKHNAK